MMVNIYNPNTGEAEVGELPRVQSYPTWQKNKTKQNRERKNYQDTWILLFHGLLPLL